MFPFIRSSLTKLGLRCIIVLVSAADAYFVFVVLRLLLNQLSGAIDPQTIRTVACDEFYNLVCKLHSQERKPMSTVPYVNTLSRMLEILDSPKGFTSTKTYSVVRQFYSICQKPNSVEDDLEKIREIFRKSGGFPVLEGASFDNSNWSWLESTRKLRKLGLFMDSFFATTLGFNPLDSRNVTFHIKHPKLDIIQKNYCEEGRECWPVVSFVTGFVEMVSMQFGVDMRVALDDGKNLFDLEEKLLNMVWDHPEASKESLAEGPVRTLADLSSSFGFINWREYFIILLGGKEFITEDLVVVVECPGYLKSLERVFKDTPNRILANFMMWSVLVRLQDYIPGHRRTSLDCYNTLQNTMPVALQSMYVKSIEFFDSQTETIVLAIATEIKEEFLKRVRSSNWMSDLSRKEIAEKIEKIKIKIKYPQILLNSSFIDDYYRHISVNDNALESMLSVQKFNVNKYFNLCCKLVEDVLWDLSDDISLPLVYYDSAQNSIHILQGVLQDPIFNIESSMSENFGRLGSMIAHEMSHAVDSIGYRYGGDGKRKFSFDTDYLEAFQEKAECFVQQYNSFMEFTGEVLLKMPHSSGEFKKLEIVADSVGLDLSFAAYRTYSEKTSIQAAVKFANMSFTPEQMFFVNFAKFFCVKYSKGELFFVLLDDHAPNSYRVEGALTNSEDFGKVFNCKLGSRMNSKRKCRVW